MSGGAGKRARRGEKASAAQAVLNAMPAGDRKALHEAMHLLPQPLPNVASSGQDVKKSSTEPVKAGNMASDESLDHFRRFMAGDKTMITQLFCNNPSLSPLHEACRATIQRVEPKKNAYTAGYVELHNKVLREELLLRAENIREDQARREKHINEQIASLKREKKFFEENICDLQQKASIQTDNAGREESAKTRVQCAQQ